MAPVRWQAATRATPRRFQRSTRSTRPQEHEGHEDGDEEALGREGDASVTRQSARARTVRGYGVSIMQGARVFVAKWVKHVVL